ncbi:hypothetical protein [Azonexus sp.]|jgi:hypothetical protein|uniref:hypothetical protein n=1 Tax=Azonexus sp. TaxID=1872668 RepID=UPI002836FA9F|nr:hypothetical protein [Azonexus sp.]MDR1995748.1 hypothetical protein [Azonexus sp.]
MCQKLKVACLVAILFVLAGCAGKDFTRPASDTFKLGQTNYSQVVQKMGEPGRAGDVLQNEKPVKSITYVYASTGGEPLEDGVIPARALTYYFYSDILVGQEFLSSFKSDNSNFDSAKVESIKKGKTSRAEVIQMLGKPTASFIPPMVKTTSGEAVGYSYQTTRGGAFSGFKFFHKVLRISFDDKDIVSDVDYVTSETK